MFTRYLGGLAACLGVAGTLAAQPAASLGPPQAPAAQIRLAGYQSQVPTQLGVSIAGTAPAFHAPPLTQTVPVRADTPKPAYVVPQTEGPTPPAYGCDQGCADCLGDCPSCDCLCGPPGRVWVFAEWLYWVARGDRLPALVTAAPPGTARPVAGTLGGPGTTVLFGDRRANDDFRNGFRVGGGAWLDPCQTLGIDASFFYLQPSRQRLAVASNGTGILTRPFTNALTGAADTQLVSFPGVVAGSVVAEARSAVLGGGGNFLCNLLCNPCGRLDMLLGYRYLNLRDDVTVRENLTALPGSAVPAGTAFAITDRFQTQNSFNGPAIGLAWERRMGNWFVGVRSSVAMGVSHEVVTISGATTITTPGAAPATFPGGLLAQPTNIGRYTANRFAVVPEVGVRVGLQVTEHMRAFVGYDFLYWSNVVRAGEQIDLRVNPNQIPPAQPLSGPALPVFTPHRTGYWLQGIGAGLEFRF